jgi:hypothetical protein
MKYYSMGEFAELIGKTRQTLRNWDKRGFSSHIMLQKAVTDITRKDNSITS